MLLVNITNSADCFADQMPDFLQSKTADKDFEWHAVTRKDDFLYLAG